MTDLGEELRVIRTRQEIARRRRYACSRLMPFRHELVDLRVNEQASIRELAAWLRHFRRVRVSPSTIWRFLSRLPELQTGGHPDEPHQ